MILKTLFSKNTPAPADAVRHEFFPSSVTLDGVKLIRNGTGVRTRFTVPIYEVALYVPNPSRDVNAILAPGELRQLRFVARRELAGTSLGAALLSGVQKNVETGQFTDQMGNLIEIFRSQDKIPEGHTFRIDCKGDQGVWFFIDEQLKGKPIVATGFDKAVLSIWLGAQSADENLKKALLRAR